MYSLVNVTVADKKNIEKSSQTEGSHFWWLNRPYQFCLKAHGVDETLLKVQRGSVV